MRLPIWSVNIGALAIMFGAYVLSAENPPPTLATQPVKPLFTIPDSLQLKLQKALTRKLLADRELDRILQQARKENPAFKEVDAAMEDLLKTEQEARAAGKVPKECMLRLSGDWECPAPAAVAPATVPTVPATVPATVPPPAPPKSK